MYTVNDNLEATIKAIYKHSTAEYKGEKTTITIGNHCRVFTGKKDVNQSLPSGKNKFYSCSPTPSYSNEAIYEGKAVLVAGNGSFTGRTTFVNEAFDLYQRTYAITPLEDGNLICLIYAALQTDFQNSLQSKLHGSAIPYIVYGDLADFSFEITPNYTIIGNQIAELLEQILRNNSEIERLLKLCDVIATSMSRR